MKKYTVTSDFYDKDTGDLVKAGSEFEADEERTESLRKAGVIGKEIPPDDSKEGEKADIAAKKAAEVARKAQERPEKEANEAAKTVGKNGAQDDNKAAE